jgi:arsenate reductase
MSVVVYGIPNCDTVRKARAWLAARGVAFAFRDLRRDGVDATLLSGWLADTSVAALLNRRGATWRALDDAQRAIADETAGALALMAAHPALVKRPVLERDGRVVALGFSPERYASLF